MFLRHTRQDLLMMQVLLHRTGNVYYEVLLYLHLIIVIGNIDNTHSQSHTRLHTHTHTHTHTHITLITPLGTPINAITSTLL